MIPPVQWSIFLVNSLTYLVWLNLPGKLAPNNIVLEWVIQTFLAQQGKWSKRYFLKPDFFFQLKKQLHFQDLQKWYLFSPPFRFQICNRRTKDISFLAFIMKWNLSIDWWNTYPSRVILWIEVSSLYLQFFLFNFFLFFFSHSYLTLSIPI